MSALPAVTRVCNEHGVLEYHVLAVADWDGFESLAKYLEKYWSAVVVERDDNVYSRRWVLRSDDVSVSLYHDSQKGNFFLREDGGLKQDLLERIEADLIGRLG
ncbi:hypothetical protein [Pseudomonas fontis]|uniref:Uncharacterized protein n=1 Tax=Pseudomonas fontis TaxID=2942633 RepID=A0ABT5NUW3_9PSED|nr:hypothetical protein [Pseudomonas fontis]MDD0976810.1 hypothetical protein [Pseudomonas fontis]MDD0991966.1 hypothetical protein [Pseudomonas fontis]